MSAITKNIFLFLVICNLILLLLFRNYLEVPSDTQWSYSPAAISLLRGEGYRIAEHINTHHPPLFSLFIAAIYGITGQWDINNQIYPLAAILLQSTTCFFLYKIGEKIGGKRTGIIAAILFNFYPFFVVLTATKYAWNAMPLFLFIFYFFLYVYFTLPAPKTFYFIRGVLLGLCALVWSAVGYLWVLVVAYEFLKGQALTIGRRILLAGIFVLGFLIPMLTWSGYIYSETKQKIFISSSLMPSMIDGLVRHDHSKLRQFQTVVRAKDEKDAGNFKGPFDIFAFYFKELKNHSSDAVYFLLYKASRAWFGTDAEKFELAIAGIQIPYLLLGFLGIYEALKMKEKDAYLLLAIIIYFWLITFLVLSTIRYMMPAMGLWMIFAAYGIKNILQKLKVYS